MSEFHFLRPWWFAALLPLLILLWILWQRQLHSRSWQDICDPELLSHLLIGKSTRRANWPLAFLLIGALIGVSALAGPTWQKQPQPVLRQQSALIIALDVSRSMLVADLKPSRLVRARLKIEDILRQRREGQTALIAFTADAFTVTPLTDDTRTIQALLGSLDPDMMPVPGSRPPKAFELAGQLLKQAGLSKGKLLLVSDEDRPQQSMAAASQLREQGLELDIIGVGTPEGAPIPLAGGGFFKDRQGNMVLPRLNESGLRELAAAGGGAYRRLAIDDSDFKVLLKDLSNRRLDEAEKGGERTGDLWQDAGVWLVWPLALLALCGFRRGWLLVFPLLLLVPPSAQAFEWSELWQNSQQQAYEKYQQGAYQDAAKQFADPRWQAGSHYQAGDYEAALGAAPQPETADDWYNRGNMLAQSGTLQDALKAYDEALKRDPESADAKANRDLVEQALKQQNQQQQNDQGEQGQSSDQQDPQQGEDQKQQQSQGDNVDQSQNPDPGQQQNADQQNQKQSDNQQQAGQQAADKQQNAAQDSKDKPQPQQAHTADSEQQDQAAQAADQHQQEGEKQGQQAAMADNSESQQPEDPELQQWLRRVPDDPGGLLRRKFQYQYRQMYQQGGQEDERSW